MTESTVLSFHLLTSCSSPRTPCVLSAYGYKGKLVAGLRQRLAGSLNYLPPYLLLQTIFNLHRFCRKGHILTGYSLQGLHTSGGGSRLRGMKPTLVALLSLCLCLAGCSKKITKEDVVGTYEGKGEGTVKFVLHENEKVELFENGNKFLEGTWKMVGKETHLDCKSVIVVIKIEPNGDLDLIARIRNSKREEIAKDPQRTLKKIK